MLVLKLTGQQMEFLLEPKDVLLIITTTASFVGVALALKYRAKRNTEKNEETEDGIRKFKEYAYEEWNNIKDDIQEVKNALHDFLSKKEAEDKYMTIKEQKLVMETIDVHLENIFEALKDMKNQKKEN